MKIIRHRMVGAVLLAIAHAPLEGNAGQPPVPPVKTVLERVAERAGKEDENDRAFQERYHYTRTKVTEYRNAKGDLKKREEKTSVNDPVAATASPNPLPPSPSPPTRSPKDTERNEPVSDTHSNIRGKAFEKRDFQLNDDLLGRFEFTIDGREMINGRSTLILDFKPADRKLPVRNLKDRFINKAAGRIWVDETDYALSKVDLFLTEKVNVIGGLVGAVWQFNYQFVRDRTKDGLWFTRTVDWHLEGRELFLRRTTEYHEAKTGVRKAR